MKEALDYFNSVCKRKSLCFLLSDFCTENYEKALKMAAHRHELVCVQIKDPREQELPSSGLITLQDAETGQSLVIDTGDRSFRKAFLAHVQEDEKKRLEFFRRHKIDFFEVNTLGSTVVPLIQYINRRERRLKMR